MTSNVPEKSVDWTGDVTTVIGIMVNTTTTEVYSSTNSSNCTVNCSTPQPPSGGIDTAEVERIIGIVVPTLFAVIFFLGLVGNTMVILVVALDKNMRNTTNILILMLAVADLLFIIFCVPFTATSMAVPVWPFGKEWCKISQYLIYVCAYASVYSLVLMSLDRYLAVVHAIRSMGFRTERNTWLAIGVTWTIISLGHIPLFLEVDTVNYVHEGQDRSACVNVLQRENRMRGVVFYSCFITFGYLLPLSATCLMYGLMLKRLHGAAPGGKTNKSQESMRAKRRVTKMVVIIVVVFAVCWLPIQIILLLQALRIYPGTVPFIAIQVASNCLAYMNSCVNPFLYAFLSENFRRSFRKFLCCKSPVSRRSEYELVSVKQTENVSLATGAKTCT